MAIAWMLSISTTTKSMCWVPCPVYLRFRRVSFHLFVHCMSFADLCCLRRPCSASSLLAVMALSLFPRLIQSLSIPARLSVFLRVTHAVHRC
jgi:hypothetical protein